MNYLIDTCVISEYLRKKSDKQVIDWLDQQDETTLFLSSLTIAELKKGYFKLQHRKVPDQARAEKINRWIDTLEERFSGRILDVSPDILEQWVCLCGFAEAQGQSLPVMDSLIAATAKVLKMTVVTRNVKDFKRCVEDLEIFNPYPTDHVE